MKRVLALVVVCCLVAGSAIGVTWRRVQQNSVVIGEEEMKFENPIYNVDGMTYVPLRELGAKLRIPVEWNDLAKQAELKTHLKQTSLSEETKLAEGVVIPDEETARALGRVILERHTGRKMEYKTSYGEYYLRVEEYDEQNAWKVSQWVELNDGGMGANSAISPTVLLNKNTGEVTYLHLEELEENVARAGIK